jgi:hypothetical protein
MLNSEKLFTVKKREKLKNKTIHRLQERYQKRVSATSLKVKPIFENKNCRHKLRTANRQRCQEYELVVNLGHSQNMDAIYK